MLLQAKIGPILIDLVGILQNHIFQNLLNIFNLSFCHRECLTERLSTYAVHICRPYVHIRRPHMEIKQIRWYLNVGGVPATSHVCGIRVLTSKVKTCRDWYAIMVCMESSPIAEITCVKRHVHTCSDGQAVMAHEYKSWDPGPIPVGASFHLTFKRS